MDRRVAYIVMAVAAASLIGAHPVQAQSGILEPVIIPITVHTDAQEYSHSSTIEVNGGVKTYKPGTPVTLIVISPQGNRVNLQQLDVDPATNTYATTINTGGNLWNYDGRYTIKVQYGVGQGASNKVHVDLTGSGITNPVRDEQMMEPERMSQECAAGELSVGADCVQYTMSGGSVTGASAMYAGEGGGTALLLNVDATEPGALTIFPNKMACGDTNYIVLVDGQEWDDISLVGDSLTVSLFAGASNVEIIGACVVPEFGALTAMVLVLAVIAVVVASSRGRIGIMPKY